MYDLTCTYMYVHVCKHVVIFVKITGISYFEFNRLRLPFMP
jgi:hypothetical protein